MQEKRKRFLLDNNLIYTLALLSNDKAGELFKHILAYVNKLDPVSEDLTINVMFEPIKQDLIKDALLRNQCSKAGLASAEVRKKNPTESNGVQQSSTEFNGVQQKSTESKKGQQKEKPIKPDYQEIINIFNRTCVNLPSANLTADRIRLIDKILETYTLEQIGQVFKNTAASDYLNGKKVEWKANLTWLLNIKNFVKVLEGNYNNVALTNPPSETFEDKWKKTSDAVDRFYANE